MENLVNQLQTNDTTKLLMKQFDRSHFSINKMNTYIDKPSSIGFDQTISAPHMHAKAIEYLDSKKK